MNPRFAEITGYSLDEVRGRNPRFLKFGHTPPEEYQRLWATIVAVGTWRGELLNKKKNGELYWAAAAISPIKSAEVVTMRVLGRDGVARWILWNRYKGPDALVVGVGSDITRFKELE